MVCRVPSGVKFFVKYADVNWATWRPRETATLVFVRMDGMVLLIRKLQGMGAGLLNAPGGRVEPGETPLEGAIREAREELHVTPFNPQEAGVLEFEFTDGYSLRCHVFTASSYDGVPVETEEAIPLWIDEREMPYNQMWADDRVWFPLVLAGRKFRGRFLFEGEQMLGCEMDIEPPTET
ncbi:MAG TPA: 8-oxo-dGTP diphosphatase [Lentisphaerae bacterium]|jgi:8-oxo-dGTP diphosphatase|nr:8-oxo-dGTP diphosphatase [Lentisphaerota bacterium]